MTSQNIIALKDFLHEIGIPGTVEFKRPTSTLPSPNVINLKEFLKNLDYLNSLRTLYWMDEDFAFEIYDEKQKNAENNWLRSSIDGSSTFIEEKIIPTRVQNMSSSQNAHFNNITSITAAEWSTDLPMSKDTNTIFEEILDEKQSTKTSTTEASFSDKMFISKRNSVFNVQSLQSLTKGLQRTLLTARAGSR